MRKIRILDGTVVVSEQIGILLATGICWALLGWIDAYQVFKTKSAHARRPPKRPSEKIHAPRHRTVRWFPVS